MQLSTDHIRALGASPFNYWFGYVANSALVVWMASHAALDGRLLLNPARAVCSVAAGLATWSLLEYVLHRFVYHAVPSFLQVGHRLHHQTPKMLLGIPWYVSAVVVVASFKLVHAIWPAPAVALGASATWLGYVGYCILHHAAHHWPMRAGYLRRIRRHHLVHHAHPGHNWGFVTPFWDGVFGTQYKPASTRLRLRKGVVLQKNAALIRYHVQNRGKES